MSAQEEWRSSPNISEYVAEAWVFLGGSKHLLEPKDLQTTSDFTERPSLSRIIEIVGYITSDPLCVWVSRLTTQVLVVVYQFLYLHTHHYNKEQNSDAPIRYRKLLAAQAEQGITHRHKSTYSQLEPCLFSTYSLVGG